MRSLFLLFLCALPVFGQEIHFDKKSGPMYGLGITQTRYRFPVRFTGATKSKVDDSNNLIGPVFNLGYDVVPFGFLLLGVRGEAYMADTLNMGNQDDKKKFSTLKGKMSGLNVTGRVGIPFKLTMKSILDEELKMTMEIFAEGGVGKLWASATNEYRYKANPQESYKDSVRDERLTGIVSVGVNLATLTGNFFELKAMQTRTISNTVDYSTGSASTSSGTVALPQEREKDLDTSTITAFTMSFGHHW